MLNSISLTFELYKEVLRCKDIIKREWKELGKIIEKGKRVHDKLISRYYFYSHKKLF